MGKKYSLRKKELNNFVQECVMKCLKNKDSVNSVVKNTLNEWGVIRVPDGKGGHKFILDDSDVDRNVYIDDTGIFGSPTSDTLRTSVTDETKSILVMIMCFSQNNLNENEQLLKNLYQKYTNAKNIKKILVE